MVLYESLPIEVDLSNENPINFLKKIIIFSNHDFKSNLKQLTIKTSSGKFCDNFQTIAQIQL